MPKLKTRKAASKRYKVTGNDNFLRRHALKVIFYVKNQIVKNENYHKDYV
jgi:ribosomal protein L35